MRAAASSHSSQHLRLLTFLLASLGPQVPVPAPSHGVPITAEPTMPEAWAIATAQARASAENRRVLLLWCNSSSACTSFEGALAMSFDANYERIYGYEDVRIDVDKYGMV